MKRKVVNIVLLLMCGSLLVRAPVCSAVDNRSLQDDIQKRMEFDSQLKNADPDNADVGRSPNNHKEIVENAVKRQLGKVTVLRLSDLTPPRKEFIIDNDEIVYGYSGCVNVSVSDARGHFGPEQLFWVFYRDDQVLRVQNTEEFPYTRIFVGHDINCDQ